MSSRRSYRGLLRLPAYGLYGPSGGLIATCRAADRKDALRVFYGALPKMPELREGREARRLA